MIIIYTSNKNKVEKLYSFNVVFKHWLGTKYSIIYDDGLHNDYIIKVGDIKLRLPDILFSYLNDDYSNFVYPELPLPQIELDNEINLCSNPLPVIFGTDAGINQINNEYSCSIDIFGSVFFLLTSLDEYINPARDKHNRFSAYDSFVYKAGLIDRPILNEYLEVLKYLLNQLTNGQIVYKDRQYKVVYTCDIDEIAKYANKNWIQILRNLLGSILIKQRNIKEFIRQSVNVFRIKILNQNQYDDYYSFHKIHEILSKHNIKGEFYLLCKGKSQFDLGYDIPNPCLDHLIKFLRDNGHIVGIHGSYHSAKDNELYKAEFKKIKSYLMANNLDLTSGRQHFLNWNIKKTPQVLDNAGLQYDLTLSFADRVGFRCGTCYEFPLFDLVNHRELVTIEKPLILMECSLIDERYMNLGYSQAAYDKTVELRERCRQFNGDFVILWHNTRFNNVGDIDLLIECLK